MIAPRVSAQKQQALASNQFTFGTSAPCSAQPSTPTGLTATASSSSQIITTWNARDGPSRLRHFLRRLCQSDRWIHPFFFESLGKRSHSLQLHRLGPQLRHDLLLCRVCSRRLGAIFTLIHPVGNYSQEHIRSNPLRHRIYQPRPRLPARLI